jgi:ubiquinone/menaquinone biosynthesis C-methylase UbiE
MNDSDTPSINPDARLWDRMARRYARSKVGDMAGYERTLQRTGELLTEDDDVIELGCGTGTTALHLAPATGSYLATDLSSEMIAIANEKLAADPRPNLRFQVATAESVEPSDGGFDAVLGFNYLHLVEDVDRTLKSIHGLLRPDGLFISKTPSLLAMNRLIRLVIPLMQLVRFAPSNIRYFDDENLLAAMRRAGFEIEVVERHGSDLKKDYRQFIVARRV